MFLITKRHDRRQTRLCFKGSLTKRPITDIGHSFLTLCLVIFNHQALPTPLSQVAFCMSMTLSMKRFNSPIVHKKKTQNPQKNSLAEMFFLLLSHLDHHLATTQIHLATPRENLWPRCLKTFQSNWAQWRCLDALLTCEWLNPCLVWICYITVKLQPASHVLQCVKQQNL